MLTAKQLSSEWSLYISKTPRHKTAKLDSVLRWQHFSIVLELFYFCLQIHQKTYVMYAMSKTPSFWVGCFFTNVNEMSSFHDSLGVNQSGHVIAEKPRIKDGRKIEIIQQSYVEGIFLSNWWKHFPLSEKNFLLSCLLWLKKVVLLCKSAQFFLK